MGGRKCKSKSTKHKRQQRQSEETNGHLNNNNNTGNDDPYDPDWDVQDKPINVKISPIMGRYLVASRDIAPGELILSEETLVVGPCQNTEPVCLGCLKKFDGENYIRCMGCQWPLCSPRCPGLDGRLTGHTPEECAALSANGPSGRRVQKLHGRTPLYNVIVPLRILLLEQQDLARYKAIRKMQSHDEVRRKIPAVWQANQLGVVNRIREEFGLQHFKDDEIHSICGILEVNAFEVGSGLRALFDVAFLLSHDCTPNTSHSDDEHRTLIVRASVAIPRGEAITLSYAYTIQGTLKRREHLKESKFFDCCCARCADPTELGTMCSALMCTRCGRPSVLPEEPLRPESPWRCTADPACPFEMPAVEAKKFLDRLADEAEAANPNDVPGLEATLTKYANQLHPNHYHLLGVKHSLSQVYGKVHGYLILDMSNELLERKLSICKDIMRIFDIIEPGITRLRGITLYEMHAPIMILTTRLYEASSINRKDLRTRLRKVASCLEQAAHILGFEPESSSEGATGRAAKEALERVNLWQ